MFRRIPFPQHNLLPTFSGTSKGMAQSTTLAGVLGKTAFFGSLAQVDRILVAEQMRKVAFKASKTIFSRGDAGRDLFLLMEGRVRLSVFSSDGRTLSFNIVSAGETFGEIAVLDGGVRSADAVALTNVEAMTLSQARVDALLAENPRVARAAITYLCARLRQTSEQAETIALHPIEVRLARYFMAKLKVRDGGAETSKPQPLDLGMSQGELALLVGASRQKVNAALTHLEETGAIKRSGSRLLCNAVKLARVAAADPSAR
jgi:CRP-like cAMP-binding protein